jgi:hypothetical protein
MEAKKKLKDLIIPYQKTDEAIRKRIEAKVAIPKTDYVLPLGKLGKETMASAGGKIAHLGELAILKRENLELKRRLDEKGS